MILAVVLLLVYQGNIYMSEINENQNIIDNFFQNFGDKDEEDYVENVEEENEDEDIQENEKFKDIEEEIVNEASENDNADYIDVVEEEQSKKEEKVEREKEEAAEVIQEEIEDHNDENNNGNLEIDTNLSNEKNSWSFRRNNEHLRPMGYTSIDIEKYDAYYVEETEEKVIYLTFDEGYEYGFTPAILDTLKEKDVHAAFFVTKPYIESNQDLVIRMKEEGHLVTNHSVTHQSMPDLTDEEVIWELKETERYFEEVTGYTMDPFFRPPMGEYSERVLYLTKEEGYKTVFWSIAYMDWLVDDQPGVDYVYNHFLDNHHKGAIPLLHAVSESNTEALGDVIDAMRDKGYRFGSLYELK